MGEETAVPAVVTSDGVMNHRDLIQLSTVGSGRPRKFAFAGLPEVIQDYVIGALDRREFSLDQAVLYCDKKGCKIGKEAVRTYYLAVCAERKMYELDYVVRSMLTRYRDMDPRDSLVSLVNVITTQLFTGIMSGKITFKEIDAGKLLQTLAALMETLQNGRLFTPSANGEGQVETREEVETLTQELKVKVSRSIYGLPTTQ